MPFFSLYLHLFGESVIVFLVLTKKADCIIDSPRWSFQAAHSFVLILIPSTPIFNMLSYKNIVIALVSLSISASAAPILRREVPQGVYIPSSYLCSDELTHGPVCQEHSHEKILTSVRASLDTNNPAGIVDPVFALLGDAAAAAGLGSTTVGFFVQFQPWSAPDVLFLMCNRTPTVSSRRPLTRPLRTLKLPVMSMAW